MAVPREDKLQEFYDARDAIVDGVRALAPETPQETLQNVFAIAHGEAEQRVHTNLVQQVWNGLVDPSQLGIRINGAELIILRNQLADASNRRSASSHLFLITLNSLQDQIDALGREVDGMEDGFAARYGESWREDLANKILDEDIIPQRMEGESLEDYRERVEDALMAEMLDENGNIKPEYKDHPEYGEFAEWAKKRHDLKEARSVANEVEAVFDDPASTQLQRDAAMQAADAQALDLIAAYSGNDDAKTEAEATLEENELESAAVDLSYDPADGW